MNRGMCPRRRGGGGSPTNRLFLRLVAWLIPYASQHNALEKTKFFQPFVYTKMIIIQNEFFLVSITREIAKKMILLLANG